jgi:hypothetical protein
VLRREIGGPIPVWDAVVLHIRQGELTAARSILEAGIAADRADCLHNLSSRPFYHLGIVNLRQGNLAAARALLEEHLTVCQKAGRRDLIAECLEGFAAVSAAEGAGDRAARLFGAGEALREIVCRVLPPADHAAYDEAVATARAQMAPEAFASAWAGGRLLSLDQALALALGAAAG